MFRSFCNAIFFEDVALEVYAYIVKLKVYIKKILKFSFDITFTIDKIIVFDALLNYKF